MVGLQASGQKWSVTKFAPALQEQLPVLLQKRATDSVDLVVSWKTSAPNFSGRILQVYSHQIQVVRLAPGSLSRFLQLDALQFASLRQAPVPELTTGSMDISLNRLAAAHYFFPEIKGGGQHISIREQRFDTADIDLWGRVLASGVEGGNPSTHASLMATIAAGGGNTSPEAMGAAPGAMVSAAGFANLLPLPDTQVQRLGIQVQNHSYGTVVENYYGPEAAAYDQQSANLPSLLHVFSAGNSGQAPGSGPYPGRAGRANLTGNYKYAKNVLTVGALDSFGVVPLLSSKGPAFDGRIKPELTAFGEDGSSGAAALVSGAAALVQDAYQQDQGSRSPSALVRAVLINSAFEVGAPGPNYSSGYGGLDALAAIRIIKGKQYRVLRVQKGAQVVIPVEVPAGMAKLKLTLSWTDAAAVINSSKALVNDLDMELRHSGTIYRPWVLNPNPDSLDLAARTGVDTLNNNEQIALQTPAPGLYQLVVDGRKLVGESQELAVAWQMDSIGKFQFTYPVGNTALEGGRSMLVRWQTALQERGTLEWATPGGSWQRISENTPLDQSYVRWQVPDTLGQVQLRMVVGQGTSYLSDTFVVSRQPALRAGFVCGDSALLAWTPQQGAVFQLYQLGERYLEPIRAVQDSQAVVRLESDRSGIYSVAPLVSGKPGLRSFAFNVFNAGISCYQSGFFVQEQDERSILLRAQLGTLYGLKSVRVQKKGGGVYRDMGQALKPNLSFSVRDSLPERGYNFYRVVLVLQDGREVAGEPLAVFHFAGLPVQAYPNPVQQGGNLYLQSILPGKYAVQVFDLYGIQLQSIPLQDVTNPISVRWSAGMYFLKIISDEGRVGVTRIVVY
ncbi:hypothetical protein BUE76_10325 [Cnuella takakiae]|nr:hypothetical protein BUE76_10325 [Cnuella takakiae]